MAKILIGFEESQAIVNAYRKRGYEAYSNDLKQCTGGHPEWHLKMDIYHALEWHAWDIIILHPPCTYTCQSGNRWYANTTERKNSRKFILDVWNKTTDICEKVALEQPKSTITQSLGTPSQIIHPWQFGHPETKETWLWLYGLPKLKPTQIEITKEPKIWKMGGKDRGTRRSKTYEGIAEAIADQWKPEKKYCTFKQQQLF